jgi:hypothetical protein
MGENSPNLFTVRGEQRLCFSNGMKEQILAQLLKQFLIRRWPQHSAHTIATV